MRDHTRFNGAEFVPGNSQWKCHCAVIIDRAQPNAAWQSKEGARSVTRFIGSLGSSAATTAVAILRNGNIPMLGGRVRNRRTAGWFDKKATNGTHWVHERNSQKPY